MTLESSLTIASGGLSTISQALALVSQNVANAGTPQYAAEAATQTSVNAAGQASGVQSGAAALASNPAVQAQLNAAVSQNAAAQTTSAALATIAPVLGTVGQSNDLGSLLTAVQGAFSSLLGDPSSGTLQSSVVQSAQALAGGINALANAYGQARQTAQDALVTQVGQLNTALGTIGTLGTQIATLKALGQSTADLQNQLAQAEHTVSGLVDAQFTTQANGDILVTTANGTQLPTHGANPLAIAAATTGATTFYPGGGLPGITLGGIDITAQLTGGSIGANVGLRDHTLPGYQGGLDEFAVNLSTRFAAQGLTLFANPDGTIPGSTGTPLQLGYVGYASTITVNPAVVTTPSLVRDGTNTIAGSPTGASAFSPNTAGLTGFTTLIDRVLNYTFTNSVQDGVAQAEIATTGLGATGTLSAGFGAQQTLGDYATGLTSAQAADGANATSAATDTQSLQTTLQQTLSSDIGVNLDSQLSKLVALQNAYGANAKVISTIQALFTDVLAFVQ